MTSLVFQRISLQKCNLVRNFRKLRSKAVVKKEQSDKEKRPHTPVMLREVIKYLNLHKGDMFLDMTFGAGGHTEALLKRIPQLQVFALDRDPTTLEFALELEKKYPGQIKALEGKFSDLPHLLGQCGIQQNSFAGVLFDLGCSSMQLDNAERGFSFQKDGPLDMRMDKTSNLSAADVVAYASEHDLFKILKVYGGEKKAKKIAQAIIQARAKFKPLKTTKQLSDVIKTVCEREVRTDKLNRKVSVATKTFQALRIFVNNEINELNYGIMLANRYLKPGGRAVVLTFHSGEDVIVKRQFQNRLVDNSIKPLPLIYFNPNKNFNKEEMELFQEKKWEAVKKKVLIPDKKEIEQNPRSRSAKLRVAVKISH